MCLGRYDNVEAKWRCAQRVKPGTDSQMMYYSVRENGVYAIIFNPVYDEKNKPTEALCGYLCKDKRTVMSVVLFTIPLLFLTLNLFYKLLPHQLHPPHQRKKYRN